ncbi:DUF2218 domain-containing protein [Vibrio sp. T187]|uniref:DUF2218 domain-containing protein n=1 Tax=Vibrio TaxID=662 RepID=UPI0010C965CC|nr:MULTISPECIES: DUF2218 domain-containing protein [Vibrio]MBW3696076.1 DUF2218 domain-containing protein [Vibrio sp. T187]
MNQIFQSRVEIQTEHASKYLTVMCRHFARKVPAKWDESEGRVDFPIGVTEFEADNDAQKLTIHCRTESEELLTRLKSIIEGHVDLFSRRETITLDWQ